jgi:hypothetical protein
MFKSYEYFGSFDSQHRYKIIDTDFEDYGVGFVAAFAIIDCYTKRNLPVAPNLFRYMLHREKTEGYPIDRQVWWNKRYNPSLARSRTRYETLFDFLMRL